MKRKAQTPRNVKKKNQEKTRQMRAKKRKMKKTTENAMKEAVYPCKN